MTFSRTADGGIAGHVTHGIQIDGKEDRVHTKARCCQCRFDTRVPRANYSNATFEFHSFYPFLSVKM
jgi:hypothetical protein